MRVDGIAMRCTFETPAACRWKAVSNTCTKRCAIGRQSDSTSCDSFRTRCQVEAHTRIHNAAEEHMIARFMRNCFQTPPHVRGTALLCLQQSAHATLRALVPTPRCTGAHRFDARHGTQIAGSCAVWHLWSYCASRMWARCCSQAVPVVQPCRLHISIACSDCRRHCVGDEINPPLNSQSLRHIFQLSVVILYR